jgi:hypothetical protein
VVFAVYGGNPVNVAQLLIVILMGPENEKVRRNGLFRKVFEGFLDLLSEQIKVLFGPGFSCNGL